MIHVRNVIEEYMNNSTLHGARFIVDKESAWWEKVFWALCILASWLASWKLIKVSLGTKQLNFEVLNTAGTN